VAATLEQRRKQRFEFMRCLYEMSRGSERLLFYDHEVGDAVGLARTEAEAAAQYLAEKGLVRVVMGHIISISHAGADELETALEQPQQATAHFPPAQSIAWKAVTAEPTIAQTATGPPVNEAASTPMHEASTAPLQEPSIKPLPAHIIQNDSDELAALELQRICEAIGLDPREITGELAPHHNRPVTDPIRTNPGENPRAHPRPNAEPMVEPVTNRYEEHPPTDLGTTANSGALQPQPHSRRPFSSSEAGLDVILRSLSQQLPKLGLAPDELAEAQAENDTARAQLASPKPKPSILAASLRTLLSILENAGPPLATDTRENLIAIRDFQERLRA
jgi:hypothetical protein